MLVDPIGKGSVGAVAGHLYAIEEHSIRADEEVHRASICVMDPTQRLLMHVQSLDWMLFQECDEMLPGFVAEGHYHQSRLTMSLLQLFEPGRLEPPA